jgi:hypothetical protein
MREASHVEPLQCLDYAARILAANLRAVLGEGDQNVDLDLISTLADRAPREDLIDIVHYLTLLACAGYLELGRQTGRGSLELLERERLEIAKF